MCVPIQRVHRDSAGVLTNVGGSTSDGVPWGLTVAAAAALIESRHYEFFVEIPAGKRVDVLVRTSSAGKKYLTTSPDGIASNNLDLLPDLPSPLAGVEPPFPLNIPGASVGQLSTVTSVAYAMQNQLHPLGTPPYGYSEVSNNAPVLEMPTNPWPNAPSWFHVDAVLPFPAEYRVTCNNLTLERVPGDSPVRRRDLEAEGKGWWSFEFILTKPDGTLDPTKPSRMTEIRAVLRPPASDWRRGSFIFCMSALSINSYCPGGKRGGVFIRIARKRLPATPQPSDPTPATTTMPSLVGQRLDKAFTTLFDLGLKKVFVNNGTGVITTSDLQVVSQGPPAGTVVELTAEVGLTVGLAAGHHGVKSVSVTNQSNTAKAMDLWAFDHTTGIWESKGKVPYQGNAVVVNLTNGHTYLLAAVDTTRSNCHTGRPDEGPCVYSSTSGSFVGDSSGIVVPWQIV